MWDISGLYRIGLLQALSEDWVELSGRGLALGKSKQRPSPTPLPCTSIDVRAKG